MGDIQEFINFSKEQLRTILNRKGAVLYSSVDTLTKGKYYIMGQNPGGSEDSGDTIEKTLDDFKYYKGNAYIDEVWETEHKIYDRGKHPIQKRLLFLINKLGYHINEICSSNLVFFRDKNEDNISLPDADICWPVHEKILSIVKPKIIITFGTGPKSPFEYLKVKYNIVLPEYKESYHKGYYLGFFETNIGNYNHLVIGIPHLSRYNIENDNISVDIINNKINEYLLNNYDNEEEFDEITKRINNYIQVGENIKGINYEEIKTLSEENRYLDHTINALNYTKNVLGKVNKSELFKLESGDFKYFIEPFNNICVSGSTMSVIATTKDTFSNEENKMSDLLEMNDGTTRNFAHIIHNYFSEYPILINNEQFIFDNYKIEDELDNQIKYIQGNIGTIDINYLDDFNFFIDKYYSFVDDKTKYQDFIGARSMLFYNIIFGFAENIHSIVVKKGGRYSRRDQIKYFTLGNAHEDIYTTPHIDIAKLLYKKLSSQDNSGKSVKMGRIDITDVKNIFREIISMFYNLLKLRNIYYTT